jgi:hypothetical protein
MKKGVIYYTDNKLGDPIFSTVQNYIKQANLPIVSASLSPIDFGQNLRLNLEPCLITMIKQIVAALEASNADVVFFCEHDVLYPASHFEFEPERDDIYYYNDNIWRWKYPEDLAITYDRLICLSTLCVNRKFALSHYKVRLKKIKELGLELSKGREPLWARQWGYEPGTKKTKRGGFSDDDFQTWTAKEPVIDIRHRKTFSPTKVTLDSFKHQPVNFRETTIDKIPGWDLKAIFNL